MQFWLPFTLRSLTKPTLHRHKLGAEQTPFGQPLWQKAIHLKWNVDTFTVNEKENFINYSTHLNGSTWSKIYPLWQVHVSAALQIPFRHGRLHPGTQFIPVASSDHPGLHSQTFGPAQRPLSHPLKLNNFITKNVCEIQCSEIPRTNRFASTECLLITRYAWTLTRSNTFSKITTALTNGSTFTLYQFISSITSAHIRLGTIS